MNETGPGAITPESLEKPFLIGLILMVIGIVLWLIVIGVFVSLAGAVFLCIFLYRAWSVLPEKDARTTPTLAVAFCFIPLFNLYWFFVAFWGLAKDLNAQARARGVAAPRAMEELALVSCILVPVGFIPVIGWLLMPVNGILSLIALHSIKKTAVALVLAEAETGRAEVAPV